MFDRINKPPSNEYDVELAKIELEKIKEITKQLPEYTKLFAPIKGSGKFCVDICNTHVCIETMLMEDYV